MANLAITGNAVRTFRAFRPGPSTMARLGQETPSHVRCGSGAGTHPFSLRRDGADWTLRLGA